MKLNLEEYLGKQIGRERARRAPHAVVSRRPRGTRRVQDVARCRRARDDDRGRDAERETRDGATKV